MIPLYFTTNSTTTWDPVLQNTSVFGEDLTRWEESKKGLFVDTPADVQSFWRIPEESFVWGLQGEDTAAGNQSAHLEAIWVVRFFFISFCSLRMARGSDLGVERICTVWLSSANNRELPHRPRRNRLSLFTYVLSIPPSPLLPTQLTPSLLTLTPQNRRLSPHKLHFRIRPTPHQPRPPHKPLRHLRIHQTPLVSARFLGFRTCIQRVGYTPFW